MNIYEALYYINKKTKELSKKWNELKAILSGGHDLNDKELIQEIYEKDVDSIMISRVFPYEDRSGLQAECYADVRKCIQEHQEERNRIYNEILTLEDDLDEADENEITEINAKIEELNDMIEEYDEYIYGLETLLRELNESYDNRGKIIAYLRKLREQQIKLYSMKDKVIHILDLPLTVIHVINEKKYKYYHVQYDGKQYGYHIPCRDNEDISGNEVVCIEYEPTTIDMTDDIYNEARKTVEDFIADNADKLLNYSDPYMGALSYNDECDEYDRYDEYRYVS